MANKQLLPLTHITPWEKFLQILNDGFLKPQRCRFFKEDLLYFNYGRLAHKPSDKDYNWTENSPVILFFQSRLLSNCTRFYPFDTGAVMAGRFRYTELNTKTLKENFGFSINLEQNPQLWINSIYSSTLDYIDLRPPKFLNESTHLNSILKEAYNQLQFNNQIDYRLTSIECQALQPVKLTETFRIAVPFEKKEEFLKLNQFNSASVFFYHDQSINGELPFDLMKFSTDIFYFINSLSNRI